MKYKLLINETRKEMQEVVSGYEIMSIVRNIGPNRWSIADKIKIIDIEHEHTQRSL